VRSWPAVAQSVAAARRVAVDFAGRLGATPAALAAVELAVSEAMTNAVQHAYAGRDGSGPGSVTLTVEPVDGALRVVVADDGVGMRPRPDSSGLGLGLPLIAQITQSFEVQQPPSGGTVLAMRFDLQRGHL
jgi:serine/threonine-protein kinase RsbW/stage II sporulation protein AB (anti-sigma F factor)